MIISASYKTDIPTFYGEWFMNRLRAGSCKMVNPYNRQIYEVDLTPDSVDGIVFWTKNIGPFLSSLKEVHEKGYPFIVQHTITGYPRELESRVVNSAQTIEHLKRVTDTYGSDTAIWRYDPILISSLTSFEWHLQNFENLARNLAGITDEVVVSFAQTYKKTKRNIDIASQTFGFQWQESESLPDISLKALIIQLAEIARGFNIQLRICSQKKFLIPGLVQEARCVDAERLTKVAQRPLTQYIKLQGNRKECGCFASKDIGEYDTCPHGCIYCYAVQQREKALIRYKAHDPNSEFLFPPNDIQQGPGENSQLIPAPQKSQKPPKLFIQGELFP